MKNSKISFWLIILVGVAGLTASIALFLKGAEFGDYFIGGLAGLVLIGVAFINKKRKEDKVK